MAHHMYIVAKRTVSGIFLLISVFFFSQARRHYVYSQVCYSEQDVQNDAACLYIYEGKVFEKGTRAEPHQGHACGIDVTSIMPVTHFLDMVTYLDPNYKGDICADVPTATPAPTQVPLAPTATSVPPSLAQDQTVLPSPTSTQVPTSTSLRNVSVTATPTVSNVTNLPTTGITTPTMVLFLLGFGVFVVGAIMLV